MIQRTGSHGAGTWSVPGGWVELWEDPLDGAVREVLEETRIVVANPRPLGWTDAQHHDEGVHAVTLWVQCDYVSGQPTVVEPEKCPRVEWVSFDLVDQLPLFHPMATWWPQQKWFPHRGQHDNCLDCGQYRSEQTPQERT